MFHLRSLVEGAVYRELGEDSMAMQVGIKLHENKKYEFKVAQFEIESCFCDTKIAIEGSGPSV